MIFDIIIIAGGFKVGKLLVMMIVIVNHNNIYFILEIEIQKT